MRTAVLIGVGLTIAAGWRFASAPSQLTLGALILMALITAGIALALVLRHRKGLEGSGERRRAMLDADVAWFANARIDRQDELALLVGDRAATAPPTVALGLGDDGVEVWLDTLGPAGIIPTGSAVLVSGRGTEQSFLVQTEPGPVGVCLVGAFWGAVPAGHSAAVEAVMYINGPYTPGH